MNILLKIYKLFFYIFIGYPLLAISHLIKRSNTLWVIGGHHGFRDNSKYFAIYLRKNHPEIQTIWIASNHKEASAINKLEIKAYARWSIKGLLISLRAKIYIFDSYVSNVNLWTSGNAIKFNLWHGIGIKNIERSAIQGVTSKIFKDNSILRKFLHPANHIRPNVFLSTSKLMTTHFQKAFDIPSTCFIESLYPRCEVFFWSEKDISNHILKYESDEFYALYNKIKEFNHSYIYMPTWRDDGGNFLKASGINLKKINDIMIGKNSIFILKLHPNTNLRLNQRELDKYKNILLLPKNMDIYPLLKNIDTLITDYSSIYYDFILMKNKKVILFPFDLEHYISSNRDLAFDYNQYTPGYKVFNFQDLLQLLKNEDFFSQEEEMEKIENIRKIFWGNSMTKKNSDTFLSLQKIAKSYE